jgi:hypothetical protein
MSAVVGAFGVPITVTRPDFGASPVSTTGVWLPERRETAPFGSDFHNLGARKVMAVTRSATVPNADRGTLISAPEFATDVVKTWRVDGYDGPSEPDVMRLILVPTT